MPTERLTALAGAFALLLAGSATLVAQEETEGYVARDEVAVERALAEVLARPEFRRLVDRPEPEPEEPPERPSWLDRFLDWADGWFSPGETPERPVRLREAWTARALVYGPAALLLLVLVVFIVRWALASMRATDRALPESGPGPRVTRAGAAPGETPPDTFWARAETFAAQGHYKPAIRELLLGAMSAVERRGLIRHRQGLTNRDYLDATRGTMRASLGTLVTAFERVYFGRRDATAETFQNCADAFRQAFSIRPEQEAS